MVDTELKTYLVERQNGEILKIEIPISWKVTFGPLVPGGKGMHNGRDGLALRIYETKDKQRAVITDVTSFRDTSFKISKYIFDGEKDEWLDLTEASSLSPKRGNKSKHVPSKASIAF